MSCSRGRFHVRNESMVPKIIISPDLEERRAAIDKLLDPLGLKTSNPDLLYFDDSKKLGISQVKEIKGWLSIKPYQGDKKVVVIESAHNLTTEAQNGLLKTLEEPPGSSIIILGVSSEEKLLATILSRCEIIKVQNSKCFSNCFQQNKVQSKESFSADIEKLISSTIEQRFEYIEKLSDKEGFLNALVVFFHNQLISHPGGGILEFTKKLLQAQEWEEANVNIRGILEYLMLEMPS